jgi:hypothetical protein
MVTATTSSVAAGGGGLERASTLDVTMGVYFDAEGTVCSGTIAPGTPGTVYIVARSAPGTEIISGAEFRFAGLPASWTVFSVPNPNCLSLGDPFANGVNIAATGTGGVEQCDPAWATFLMYTVVVFATEEVNDVVFELTHRNPPGNPAFRCPLVTDCSGWEKHCVQTSPCFVNSSTAPPCNEVTAVEHMTWTGVREMYR